MMPSLYKVTALFAACTLAFANAKDCPPMGAVLPAPKAPSQHEAVQEATSRLKLELDEQFASLSKSSAVSIAVKSLHEDELLFNYHFTPPSSGAGVKAVDENTIYRIASGTKLFTVLAALLSEDIDMSDSVLKYLPELKDTFGSNPITSISWEDISVESLAAHLSGVGVDTAQDLGVVGSKPWVNLGLPGIPVGSGPSCSGLAGTRPCTREDLLSDVNKRPPVYSPNTTPVYSNIGLALLGYVVEAAYKKPFEDVLQEQIFDVVGMHRTSTSKAPPPEAMFIPEGDTIWNASLGAFDAAGGMYSTVADMIAFAEAILKNDFLSPVETRNWMKPASTTASLGYLVGRPWEIVRTDKFTSDGRLVDVYTKSGDLGLYHSLTGLIPDYDIVVSVMMAGIEVSSSPIIPASIFGSVLRALVPAIEKAGRDDATKLYAGEYVDETSNSRINFALDDGPGLLIKAWTVRGFDVLNNIPKYSLYALGSDMEPSSIPVTARVYPTNLEYGTEQAWRAVFGLTTPEQKAQIDEMLFSQDASCLTWLQQDRRVYNSLSLDEFIFVLGDGQAEAVRSPAFDVVLARVGGSPNGKLGVPFVHQ